MPQDQNLQNILNQAQKAIADADAAIVSSNKLIQDQEKELVKSREKYEKEQAKVDAEIKQIVDDMDVKTLQFLKDME
ncbi:MAG TPA: hypothetical protein PLR18_04025 [bacterium]|nr:hypothetical protein [bacterium]